MKRFLWFCIAIIAIAFIGSTLYSSNEAVQSFVDLAVDKIRLIYEAPCSRPIPYSLGSVDAKFGVSTDYFLAAIRDAEAIWEKPSKKDLFVYDPAARNLTMNLIYDYRQEASSKLESIGITVDDNRATYDALEVKYDAMKKQFAEAKSSYSAATAAFTVRYKAYQDKVGYWNERGGAPSKEYGEIQAEKVALEGELSGIKSTETQLNEMVSVINAMVVVINTLANTLNISVKNYNTIGATLGDSFEEGLYQSSGGNAEIDIYEFKDRASLVRVLAHELGHALGLDHVKDPKAIMYSFNSSTNIALTSDDLSALNARCGVK